MKAKENQLIGRESEIAQLKRVVESNRSEFVVVFGRRRIGKTFLIRKFFNDHYHFSYVGQRDVTDVVQLQRFALALQNYAGLENVPDFKNWFEAFDALKKYLATLDTNTRKIIFIDEMPWIDRKQCDFVKALEDFWNAWANLRDDIVFVACGSATSWMVDNLMENQGGLHNRITSKIYLHPFTLKETELYLNSIGCHWDRYQIVECYMVFGGVPFYLSMLNSEESLAQNIDQLFFKKNALLSLEFNELYNSLFSNASKYIAVVTALSQKREGLDRAEIAKTTGISGGALSTILTNLERCDFILGYSRFNTKKNGIVYRLCDFYSLFYFNFIVDNSSKDENFWTHRLQSPKLRTWQGLTFEIVCLQHLDQIKLTLGISGMATEASIWRCDNAEYGKAQIDLLIKRADRIIDLCEIKFSTEKYSIDKDYAERIRNRTALFRQKSKTRYGLANIFITMFGIVKGKNSGVVDREITADQLFV